MYRFKLGPRKIAHAALLGIALGVLFTHGCTNALDDTQDTEITESRSAGDPETKEPARRSAPLLYAGGVGLVP